MLLKSDRKIHVVGMLTHVLKDIWTRWAKRGRRIGRRRYIKIELDILEDFRTWKELISCGKAC